MKKVKWLERSLITGGHLALVTTQKEYEAALKDLKLESNGSSFCPTGFQACTHTFTNVNGSIACIVGFDMNDAVGRDPMDVAALLVHEAVHVWQEVEAASGKMGCFGTEGEAYFIQSISAQLMYAYKEKLK